MVPPRVYLVLATLPPELLRAAIWMTETFPVSSTYGMSAIHL
jgi:hypothetical protein